MNTPDTEWRTKASEVYEGYADVHSEKNFVALMKALDVANAHFSSRDTYWKERVRKEVEGLRKQDEFGDSALPFYGTTGARAHVKSFNQALDTLLDNLK